MQIRQAKQADDDALANYAMRVKARAIRRCGELLQAMAPKNTPGRPKENGAGGGPISRTQAAEEAGLSTRQKKAALRLATIPKDDFDAAVESDTPPTVTKLAEMGTVKKEKDPFDIGDSERGSG